MKHPSSRAFFAYWDRQRGAAPTPQRSEIEPGAVRELLGDIFVLSCDSSAGYPFRVAGTRLCALLGRDLKGESLTGLFAADSRQECEDILGVVAEEALPLVAGATTASGDGSIAHLELLLLPFAARAHTPLSMTGLLAPLGARIAGEFGELRLTAWRTLGRPSRRLRPRVLRKWEVARGLMVYEGLR
ncbi:PAS domain-containing protein [Rhodopseudomonas pseudopalustris]|uniref:PAS domain-containing protein n=1 Tax=Rhodopseudomonas pseudopalustris TaxID=1513892 RepID=A0A1H8Q4Z5_9BRAD|nr:PAS domain-containing protein [Rhodopseudomonas pseudopalustris]SEO49315.1 PAS domain-containing protein [Rhodopseudomonas pseudopalustris]